MSTQESVPLVSVITTVYNAESFLEPTLRSLLTQTFTDFEAIVIDDGSTDGSADLVERLAQNDPRIRLIRQVNQGHALATNRALAETRGALIAFLDHDDLWLPQKLQRQVERLEHDQQAGFVGCYSALLDAQLRCTGWRFGTHANGAVYRRMRFCDLVGGGSVPLVRREAIERVGFLDPAPEVQGREDWEFWLRIARHFPYSMVQETLVGYVRRPSNYSADYQRMVRAGVAVLGKAALEDSELDARTMEQARARDSFGIFCLSLADGKSDEAAGILRKSLAISWLPVVLSPQRLGIVLLFALARVLPEKVYARIWRTVTRRMFGITPGEEFLAEQT